MTQVSVDEIMNLKLRRPYSTSRDRGWNNITIDIYDATTNFHREYPPLDHLLLCYNISGSKRLVQRRGGIVHSRAVLGGTSLIMPAGCASIWEGDTGSSARLRIPTSLLASASEQLWTRCRSQFEIGNVFEIRDHLIEQLATLLVAELDNKPHPGQLLIVDQIAVTLAAHILRSYNLMGSNEERHAPSLGGAELSRLIDFINDNLDRSIDLTELAALVDVSRFHFVRLFKHAVGVTPIRFVEQCRVQRARALILETNLSLAEVGRAAGFADQSHFTRRFHLHMGITPAVFAREQGRRRSKPVHRF